MSQLARFQKRINESIPLTNSLGVRLFAYDGEQLVVNAPLEPNHNHQGTGFGGSVYAVAVVAAWGLVELALEDWGLEGSVVVQVGSMEYLEPVDDDFYAVCRLPCADDMARFRKSLARHGKGRLNLRSEVYCGSPTMSPVRAPAATFEGRFVVQDARTTIR